MKDVIVGRRCKNIAVAICKTCCTVKSLEQQGGPQRGGGNLIIRNGGLQKLKSQKSCAFSKRKELSIVWREVCTGFVGLDNFLTAALASSMTPKRLRKVSTSNTPRNAKKSLKDYPSPGFFKPTTSFICKVLSIPRRVSIGNPIFTQLK